MKETIERASREYADGLRSVDKKNTYDNIEVDSSRMVAFKRGAQWHAEQSPWISVEDTSPTKKTEVLLKTSFGHRMIGVFVDTHTYERQICGSPLDWEKVSTKLAITHWMPIPE